MNNLSNISANFEHVQRVSDKEAHAFIKTQDLELIVALENEIKDGKTPEQIADWWLFEYKREKMAKRIFHAARHIYNEARRS